MEGHYPLAEVHYFCLITHLDLIPLIPQNMEKDKTWAVYSLACSVKILKIKFYLETSDTEKR